MAFEESFGGQADPGRPYFYKTDTRRGVDTKLIIVPVELTDRDAMNKAHGIRKRNKATREMEWRIPESKQDAANKFLAARIWKDSVNAWIRLSTPEAVALYVEELGYAEGHDLKVGSELLMDGRWTDALRADILTLRMANWIVIQGTDAQAEADIDDADDAGKNSQSGSTSVSADTPPSPSDNATRAN